MITDENQGDIINLYFNQHKTIREIAKITKKSSRDIITILRNSEHKGNDGESNKICGNNTVDLNQGSEYIEHRDGQSSFPNFHDYYPYIAKDKVLQSANEIYDKLVKGLANTTVSTAAWNR